MFSFPKRKGKPVIYGQQTLMMLSALQLLVMKNIKKFGEVITKVHMEVLNCTHQKTISVLAKHQPDNRYTFIIMLHYFMCCKYRVIHLHSRNVKYLNYPRNMMARAKNDEG